MTPRPTPSPRRRSRRSAGAPALAGAFLLAASMPILAASPAPAAVPDAGPWPTLTFAPLVTLPPVAEPWAPVPEELADGYSLGAAGAPVQVDLWSDFQCPFCRLWTAQVEPLLIERYIAPGLVRLIYRPMAFLGEESRWAMVAADLAAEQGRFWPFHDYLFANWLGENVGAFGLDRLLTMADAAGLDLRAFTDGLVLERARERFARLEAASDAGASALGISRTPSVVVDGVLLPAPDYETVATAIDAALAADAQEPVASATP